MAQSSILGGRPAPKRNEGSRIGTLGPSDTSDSGSDIQGGPGLVDTQALGLDAGPTSDLDRRGGPGADFGNASLDSDSDAVGSGERALADRDSGYREGGDIAPDRIEGPDDEELQLSADEDLDDVNIDDADLAIDEDEGTTEDNDDIERRTGH
ncbi:hypothetical protein [Caldimonas brevitalea]|uniref:Chemotaxis protein n=1 Tax=Caldimonas brevitalea TaxID=413882 RepID=A0A0G3BMH8_9BURK|nr:hypothetical protein [Caldimonas brevitalea]AKJ30612.1 hypothetical protein AAW51_3921 [Caldimonas brevitalea]